MRFMQQTSLKFSLVGSFGVAGLTLACGATQPTGVGGAGGGAGTGLPCDVQKIVQDRCQICHQQPPVGGAPMPLISWADLTGTRNGRKIYDLMLERVTHSDPARVMPPVPNARLTQSEITTLQNWINAGAPQSSAVCQGTGPGPIGGPQDFPADCQQRYTMRAHGLPLEGDLSPYTIPTGGEQGNSYTCFYFRPPYANGSQALFLRGLLDKTDVSKLHHWILYGRDIPSHAPGTMSPCSAAEPGAYFITGWAPGSNPLPLPPDVGIALPPTTGELALEVHYYNPTNIPGLQDQTGLEFCTAAPNTRPHTAAISFTGSEGICLQPYAASQDVAGDCRPRTDMGDIHIVGVFPHMHKLAKNMRIDIHRANGVTEVLHNAPFDFNTQTFYPREAVIRPGDWLTTTCTYANPTPNRIPFGEKTQDEMCFGFITAWPMGALQNNPFDPGLLIGGGLQPARRCLNPLGIFSSCNGLGDYPPGF